MDDLLYLKKLGKGQNKLTVRGPNYKFNWSPRKRRKTEWAKATMKEILAENLRSNKKHQSTNSKSPSRINKKKHIWLYQSKTVEKERQRKILKIAIEKGKTTGVPWWLSGKESACQYRKHWRSRLDPWVGKIPWRRKWQPTPIFLPGKFHGCRSLAGYNPWGCKESDMTEQLTCFTF